MIGFRRILKQKRRGGAAIEFGLWLPVLLVMLGGIIDFGMFITRLQTVTRAAKDAARTAASVVVDPEATLAEIEDDIQPVIGIVVAEVMSTAGLSCGTCAVAVVDEIFPRDGSQLRIVDVRVTYDYDPVFNIAPLPPIVSGRFVLALDRQLVDVEEP